MILLRNRTPSCWQSQKVGFAKPDKQFGVFLASQWLVYIQYSLQLAWATLTDGLTSHDKLRTM